MAVESSQLPIKYDWYQTEESVTVTILVKNVIKESLNINVDSTTLNVSADLVGKENGFHLTINLAHEVKAGEFKSKVFPSKVEVTIKKCIGDRWNELEPRVVEPKPDGPPTYPSAKPKNWDEVTKSVEEEKQEGEAALNELFQKIYMEGSDEVKRAMNKSFQESGGTVLSTNWDEVSRKKQSVKPPDGLEWKKW